MALESSSELAAGDTVEEADHGLAFAFVEASATDSQASPEGVIAPATCTWFGGMRLAVFARDFVGRQQLERAAVWFAQHVGDLPAAVVGVAQQHQLFALRRIGEPAPVDFRRWRACEAVRPRLRVASCPRRCRGT